MKWIRTPPEIVAAFDKAAPRDPRIVRKPMFGYPALYLDGNMFAGTFQDKIVVRLSEQGRTRAAKTARAAAFEPMPGRAMKEYVVLPGSVVARPSALAKWIDEARDYAATLPPKTGAKTTAAKKTTTASRAKSARRSR